jgi:hypothetical protein
MLSRIFGKSIYLPSPGPVLQITVQGFRLQVLVTVQILQLYRCFQIAVCRYLLYPAVVAIHIAVAACCICSRSGLALLSGLMVWLSGPVHLVRSCSQLTVLAPGLVTGLCIWLSGLVTVLSSVCCAVQMFSSFVRLAVHMLHPVQMSDALVLFLSSGQMYLALLSVSVLVVSLVVSLVVWSGPVSCSCYLVRL